MQKWINKRKSNDDQRCNILIPPAATPMPLPQNSCRQKRKETNVPSRRLLSRVIQQLATIRKFLYA
ncbi:unnamed protein product [Enterobius vermicularis]|uniref:Uncharacterized protein n=1 Tax=Enterobius vermicularis TaxID=51028 RepID=A0A0N4UUD1_ENTVE|nr:unnamed protein product [Enterobius vermicularis]